MRLFPWALATIVWLAIGSRDLSAGGPGGSRGRGKAAQPAYSWRPVAGSNRQELYLSGHKMGVYDPDRDCYQRVASDGSLSGPVPPPWKTAPAQQAPSASESKGSTPASTPPEAPPAPEIPDPSSGGEDKPFVPTWLISALISGVVSYLGFTLAGKRWPPRP